MQGQTRTSEQIEIRKVNGSFEVHWDYQKTKHILAQRARCERLDGYIDGFIDGAFVALEIPATNIHRTCSLKGSVIGIQARVAVKLTKILADIFHPLITAEHKKHRVSARLRYLQGRAAHLESLGTFEEARG